MTNVRVRFAHGERDFRLAAGRTVLEGALEAGLNLPHSCKTGHCNACRARLLEGAIEYPQGPPLALSAEEQAEGVILLCVAQARQDLRLELLAPVLAARPIRRLPCRIARVEAWGHDVRGLFLRLPPATPLEFEAGQYIDIMLPGARRRSFSIASPPHEPRALEVHVRRVPGGELTPQLFAADIEGGLLTIEGPLGHFVYREQPPERPMLLIGGGTGLAPLKSIVRHVVETGRRRAMTLYWGVRSERDLYAHAALEALARATPALSYRPVLSEPGASWAGRRGLVHEAVLAELGSLASYEVYASGPPAMIDAIVRDFPRRGLAPERLYFDSFDFAPDSPARQASSAPTIC